MSKILNEVNLDSRQTAMFSCTLRKSKGSASAFHFLKGSAQTHPAWHLGVDASRRGKYIVGSGRDSLYVGGRRKTASGAGTGILGEGKDGYLDERMLLIANGDPSEREQ